MKKRFDTGIQQPVKKETIEVFVITTSIGGTKNYISALDKRKVFDNKYLPSYTTSLENALEFDWFSEANEKIPFIVNHMERVFKVDTIKVERPVEV